jgi:hypothetical protein
LDDGIKAVEMGIAGLNNITNGASTSTNVTAHISKSEDNLLNLVLNSAVFDELKLNVQQ